MNQTEPFLVDVPTAARLLCISRSKFYQGLSNGRIPLQAIHFGRKRLYDVEHIKSFVKSGCSPQWRPENA
ncbi:MAG: helix-turn-helix transcriptional regulator [Planctomycetota bacterium]|jgi:hypothetical protein